MARSDGGWWAFPAPPRPVMKGADLEEGDGSEAKCDAGPEASEPRVTEEGARVRFPAPPRPVIRKELEVAEG